ncbi:hypothetical protein Tco_1500372 [Tanacetum coccineum]
MKSYANIKRSDMEFAVGDFVYLKLQPYRQLTIRINKQHKLSAKFYGPFKVLERIGNVASPTTQVHLVFHVSQLKKCHSKDVAMGNFSLCDAQGLIAATPHKHLDRKLAKQGNRVVVYGLIQWSNSSEEDANWELLTDLEKRFPKFDIDP